ncbi:MAG: hypothetical protein GWP14_09330 [Actinobacteria bacterium]|nr:hypothetical protein [Actinomycetota bacterium]
MGQQISIISGEVELIAELNDSPSVQALVDILPLELRMSRWGDEYYGDCGLDVKEEPQARTLMKVGELAVWPPGSALCIFFGSTPASTGDEPVAASKVNPIGRVNSQLEPLKKLGSSIKVRVELAKTSQG